ncbi:hypothetical protein CPB84DRAFT_516845 [Gymnopilus junonius]|uniref:Uncharacterized protein n=1 Tax=Gymnopilus junonius TaxID=109634 RepID=A0A9P5P260_GYMJU|nr:hypothetical protein CPB84DRAFT_516845 [Gymnopilus junonius]
MCACEHSVTEHGDGQVYSLQPRYCRTSGTSFQASNGLTFAKNQSVAARLPCVHCSQVYFMHALSPDAAPLNSSAAPSSTVPPFSAASSSTAHPSSAPTPAWMMSGTFSGRNATLEHVRSAQGSASSSTTSSFQQWALDPSFNSTATTNDRRTNAAQRHQPAPQGLPVPARGVAQNPLLPLPTIALPRITGTRSVRNPRLPVGVQVSSSRSQKSKIFDYKFACIILPIGVSSILSQKKCMI